MAYIKILGGRIMSQDNSALCLQKGSNFNVHETFRKKFIELIKTNSLLVVHTYVYLAQKANYCIVPLEGGMSADDFCEQCCSGCKWEHGTRVMPGFVNTKFHAAIKTNKPEEAFEVFEAKRLMKKITEEPRYNFDFPFQSVSELPKSSAENKEKDELYIHNWPKIRRTVMVIKKGLLNFFKRQ
jgi:hypothetical protein